MGIYYDITNPDASYEWLYSILNIGLYIIFSKVEVQI